MKKIISILLAVMLVVSVAAVSANAYNSDNDYSNITSGSVYNPSDSYTVDANTPYAEDAVVACGGSLDNTQTVYFQIPLNDGEHEVWENKYNTFAGPDDSEPYMHACIYWFSGTGSDWTSAGGGKVAWCGYQAHLVDKENRIYSAQIPYSGSPTIIWNNGVNGGMDETKEIFNYKAQVYDANVEGAYEGDYDTLPEGTPDEDSMHGCIQVIDYNDPHENPLTHMIQYGSAWYVYYGQGCYGEYPTTSENYHGRTASCVNPEHHHAKPGDVNNDKSVDIIDVLCIQRSLAGLSQPEGMSFDIDAADVDGDGYVSIIDATRIQRYLAQMCNIDGSKPYVAEE